MDALTFIAKLIEFLAWPLAAVFVVVLLRTEIRRLLSLVRKLKAGPVEAEFEREIIRLEETTPPSLPAPAIAQEADPEKLELIRLARTDPRAAIVEAWGQVEVEARSVAATKALNIESEDTRSVSSAFRAISRANLLPSPWVGRYYELRELRNRAAHEPDFNPSLTSAAAFIELSNRLKTELRSLQ